VSEIDEEAREHAPGEPQQEPLEIEPNPENAVYLDSKRDKMGHTIGRSQHQRVRFDPESS
jgi:hypothetical protein